MKDFIQFNLRQAIRPLLECNPIPLDMTAIETYVRCLWCDLCIPNRKVILNADDYAQKLYYLNTKEIEIIKQRVVSLFIAEVIQASPYALLNGRRYIHWTGPLTGELYLVEPKVIQGTAHAS